MVLSFSIRCDRYNRENIYLRDFSGVDTDYCKLCLKSDVPGWDEKERLFNPEYSVFGKVKLDFPQKINNQAFSAIFNLLDEKTDMEIDFYIQGNEYRTAIQFSNCSEDSFGALKLALVTADNGVVLEKVR